MPLRLRVIPPAGLKPGDRRSPTTERLVEFPDDVEEITLTTDGPSLWIAKALSSAGLVKSTGEGKRLVEQGGETLDPTHRFPARNSIAVR